MQFDMPSPQETEPVISMTEEQFAALSDKDMLSRRMVNAAHDLGISFGMNGGEIKISVDGKKMTMVTTREDFGTIKNEEGEVEE